MELSAVQYISDRQGHTTAAVVPIALWRQITTLLEPQADKQQSAWDVLENLAGSVDAPADWATEHDHYLYGTPKKEADGTRS